MVITIDKKLFTEAVHIVARFSERRSATLPALGGIAIVAGDDGIKLRATNLETGIDFKVEGVIKNAGAIVVPAPILREITSSFSGTGSVTIEHAGDVAAINSGAGKSILRTLPLEDFPIIPLPKNPETRFTIGGGLLKELIGSVMAFASSSSVRPELASVLIESEGGMMKAAASDSFRLAEKKISLPKSGKPFRILIPAKNAADIRDTLPESDITLSIDEHQCAFAWETGVVTTRLVAANYPEYKEIIPKSFSAEATLLKKDFESALRRVSVFSDTFQKIRIALDVKGKKLVLSSRNADVGESTEEVPAAITGESVELSFNHRYVGAPLSLITADNLTVSASGIGRPLVIRGAGDASYLYLVMPMNQ